MGFGAVLEMNNLWNFSMSILLHHQRTFLNVHRTARNDDSIYIEESSETEKLDRR
jgi:hypothetical protein